MPKGFKIDVSNYTFETKREVVKDGQIVIDEATGEPKLEDKKIEVYTRLLLPIMLCNPSLGSLDGRPDPEFDLFEIGVIAKLIENALLGYVLLDNEQYQKLEKRINKMGKQLGYQYFEMVRRIKQAEEIELDQKAPA